MSFLRTIIEWLPSPFKTIRRRLNIEHEWQEFKHHLKPHRGKILVVGLVVSYPLYARQARYLGQYCYNKGSQWLNDSFTVQGAPFQITDNLGKNLIRSILQDGNVKEESLTFVNSLIQDDKFVEDILQLLLSALKSPTFLSNLGVSSKELAVELVGDERVQTTLKRTLAATADTPEVKKALVKVVEEVVGSEETKGAVSGLLAKGMADERVKQSLSGAVNYAVAELLRDEQMINQLKIFIFFLLRRFQNDDEIKSMMDILFAKGLGLGKKKKESDLQKLLRGGEEGNGRAQHL